MKRLTLVKHASLLKNLRRQLFLVCFIAITIWSKVYNNNNKVFQSQTS
uniref:Uncharacterized protein n=1 Tax=Arundo donax TaxID=35708 RepID=A0A0A9FR17_ARUDO